MTQTQWIKEAKKKLNQIANRLEWSDLGFSNARLTVEDGDAIKEFIKLAPKKKKRKS